MTQVTKQLAKEATKKGGNGNGNGEKQTTVNATVKKENSKPELNEVQKAQIKKPEIINEDIVLNEREEKLQIELLRNKALEEKLAKIEKQNADLLEKHQPKKLSFQEMQEEIETIVSNGKLLEKLVVKKETFKRRLFEVKEFVFGSGIGNGSLTLKDDHNKDIHTTDNRFLKVAHQAILKEAAIMLDEIEVEIKGFMEKLH